MAVDDVLCSSGTPPGRTSAWRRLECRGGLSMGSEQKLLYQQPRSREKNGHRTTVSTSTTNGSRHAHGAGGRVCRVRGPADAVALDGGAAAVTFC